MSIQNAGPSPFASTNIPSHEAFRAAAGAHAAVQLSVNGENWDVKGAGTMPGSGRPVSWVEGDADATSVFVASLGRGYSQGIGTAVARELDLQPLPGKPLSSRLVMQALEMADTSRASMAGVDFMTRLDFSASGNGAAFRQSVFAAGSNPADIGAARRQEIDGLMAGRFDQAAALGEVPVSRAVAAAWLREILGSPT